jgi:hypothetical protein
LGRRKPRTLLRPMVQDLFDGGGRFGHKVIALPSAAEYIPARPRSPHC